MKGLGIGMQSFKKLYQAPHSPEYIAKGFALGSFIGMMPIPGFQVLVSLTISTLIKVHRTAAVIAVFNTNLATGLLIYMFNYYLGKRVLGINPSFEFPEKLGFDFISIVLSAGADVFLSLLIGGIITGVVVSFASYHIVFYLLNKRRSK